MRTTPFVLTAFVLAGCNATMPQQTSRPGPADDPSRTCFEELGVDARFSGLRTKMPASINQISMEMLASTERASEEDKRWLSVMAVARQTCAERGQAFRRQHAPPGWAAAFQMGQSRILDLMADLYAGKITYGEFNTQRRRNAHETNARLDEASRQAEEAHSRQRTEAMNTLMLMNAMRPAPPVIQPYQMPQQTNCTTRYVGNTAYTSCN